MKRCKGPDRFYRCKSLIYNARRVSREKCTRYFSCEFKNATSRRMKLKFRYQIFRSRVRSGPDRRTEWEAIANVRIAMLPGISIVCGNRTASIGRVRINECKDSRGPSSAVSTVGWDLDSLSNMLPRWAALENQRRRLASVREEN